jgi:hypothetical protein
MEHKELQALLHRAFKELLVHKVYKDVKEFRDLMQMCKDCKVLKDGKAFKA